MHINQFFFQAANVEYSMVIMGRGVFALILFVTKKFDNIK